MRFLKKILLALACVTALCIPALAAGQTGSITLHFHTQDGPVTDAVFRAYLVAELRPDGSYALSEQYAAYPLALDGDVQDLAETCAGYTRRDRLSCAADGRTDQSGVLQMTDLPAGLYLILGEQIEAYDLAVAPAPSLIRVPAETESGWRFDVDADVKSEVKPPVGPETVTRRVLKIWDDDGHKSKRPAEITVQLLRDGDVFDTVTLNEKNNWRCFWDELDAARNWEVVEKECPGYTVRVDRSGATFTLTNTYAASDTPALDHPQEKPRLPQTGQLWWPVPLLAIAGLVLLLFGAGKRGRVALILAGALLLTAAIGLAGYNRLADLRAGRRAADVIERISPQTLDSAETADPAPGEEQIPDFLLDPDRDMPETELDGVRYVASLEIPALHLELPVVSRWSYEALEIAPCRYSGTVYQNNLVIAGHNYSTHFGRLRSLSLGDRVTVTDMDGNRFCFRVAEVHNISPDKAEEVTDSEWDLTLFTCTPGGQTRFCVCCDRIEE